MRFHTAKLQWQLEAAIKMVVIFLIRKVLIFRHPYWKKVIFKLIL